MYRTCRTNWKGFVAVKDHSDRAECMKYDVLAIQLEVLNFEL